MKTFYSVTSKTLLHYKSRIGFSLSTKLFYSQHNSFMYIICDGYINGQIGYIFSADLNNTKPQNFSGFSGYIDPDIQEFLDECCPIEPETLDLSSLSLPKEDIEKLMSFKMDDGKYLVGSDQPIYLSSDISNDELKYLVIQLQKLNISSLTLSTLSDSIKSYVWENKKAIYRITVSDSVADAYTGFEIYTCKDGRIKYSKINE